MDDDLLLAPIPPSLLGAEPPSSTWTSAVHALATKAESLGRVLVAVEFGGARWTPLGMCWAWSAKTKPCGILGGN